MTIAAVHMWRCEPAGPYGPASTVQTFNPGGCLLLQITRVLGPTPCSSSSRPQQLQQRNFESLLRRWQEGASRHDGTKSRGVKKKKNQHK